jgi:hypothetical protein
MLPAGVTKGAGLLKALGDRGLSQYKKIGVGDADDYSLLDVCGIRTPRSPWAMRGGAECRGRGW